MKIENLLVSTLFVTLLNLGAVIADAAPVRGDFEVEITAIDDEGKNVENADIGFSWGQIYGKEPDSGSERKLSNHQGEASFSGKTVFGDFAFGGVKTGYYPNRAMRGSFEKIVEGEWRPSPQNLTVVLKRVRNPVPMYAKEINLVLPGEGERLAFDLVEGDWVAPFGKGKERDVEFCFEGQYQSKINYDGTVTLRFLGDGSGLLPYDYDQSSNSELKMPYEAPISGYIPTWSWRNARMTSSEKFARSTFIDDMKIPRGYIFRVRAVVDSEGKVVSAMYGKIQGRFFFQVFEGNKGGIGFTYYLNPDRSRNLEFDPKRNLFPGERVVEP